jgi:hypothetical protein
MAQADFSKVWLTIDVTFLYSEKVDIHKWDGFIDIFRVQFDFWDLLLLQTTLWETAEICFRSTDRDQCEYRWRQWSIGKMKGISSIFYQILGLSCSTTYLLGICSCWRYAAPPLPAPEPSSSCVTSCYVPKVSPQLWGGHIPSTFRHYSIAQIRHLPCVLNEL